jgi:hypothetical protein
MATMTEMAMAMARADKNASFVNLPSFGHVVDIASFWTIWMRWPLVGISRMVMAYVCHLFACKLFLFSRFGRANIFKLASAGQFAKTDQNSQRGQDTPRDASRRCARRPGGPDRDTKYVLPTMQEDQNGPFASAGCVGPLEMP